MGLLLLSLQDGDLALVVPAPRGLAAHLHDLAGIEELVELSVLFVADASLQSPEAVEVLDLSYRCSVFDAVFGDSQIDVGLETHVALLHIGFGDTQKPHHSLQLDRQRPHLGAAVHVGLGYNFEQRRAGPVQIHLRETARRVQVLACVLFEVRPYDSDFLGPVRFEGYLDETILAERQIVLAYLIILRQVGIVVALSVPLSERRYPAVEGHRSQDGVFVRLLVHNRQHPGHSQTHRTNPAVGLSAKLQRAAAKHLTLRAKLHVNFQADYNFVINPNHLN